MSTTGQGVIRGGWQLWLGALIALTSVLLGLGIGSASATQAIMAGGVATSWSNYEVAVTIYDGPLRQSHQHTAARDGLPTEGAPWASSKGQSVPPGHSHLVSGFGVAAKAGSGRLSTVLASGERGAIGRGTPRTNSAQNKQFNDAIKDGERQLGRTLSKDERSAVHREISGQDYGYHDIVDEVLGMFGGGK